MPAPFDPDTLSVPDLPTEQLDCPIPLDDETWSQAFRDLATEGFNTLPHDVENQLAALTEELNTLEKPLRSLGKKSRLLSRDPSPKKIREIRNQIDDLLGQILNIEARRFEAWHPNGIDPATLIGLWQSPMLSSRVAYDIKTQKKIAKKVHPIEKDYRLKCSDHTKQLRACLSALIATDPKPDPRYETWPQALDHLESL